MIYRLKKKLTTLKSLISQKPIDFSHFLNVELHRKKLQKLVISPGTPIFIIDDNIILDRYKKLEASLSQNFPQFKIAYSFKTNPKIAHLKMLKKLKIFMEVVSVQEYVLAKELGYQGPQIIFNGPYKTYDGLVNAIKAGSIINVDTFAQIEQLKKIAQKTKKKIKIGVRVNGKLPGQTPSRFGFSLENGEAHMAIAELCKMRKVCVVGLHWHIGTNIYDPALYKDAAYLLGTFILAHRKNFLSDLKYIDLGGGFPSHGSSPFSMPFVEPTEINFYIQAIARGFQKAGLSLRKIKIIVEPGRFLVDDATIFVTKVVSVKRTQKKQVVVLDGATTMLPLVYYHSLFVKGFSSNFLPLKNNNLHSILYGATCQENDVFYTGKLPKLAVNDYAVFYCVGAYNQSMGSAFILGEPSFYNIDSK